MEAQISETVKRLLKVLNSDSLLVHNQHISRPFTTHCTEVVIWNQQAPQGRQEVQLHARKRGKLNILTSLTKLLLLFWGLCFTTEESFISFAADSLSGAWTIVNSLLRLSFIELNSKVKSVLAFSLKSSSRVCDATCYLMAGCGHLQPPTFLL